jgi:hypothetical protein
MSQNGKIYKLTIFDSERSYFFAKQGRLRSLISLYCSNHQDFMNSSKTETRGDEQGRRDGNTLLHISASEGHEHVVKWLLSNDQNASMNVNKINRVSLT